jgi:hypothetical protein
MWTQESAFFDRYNEKAVKHAREAETAGNQRHAPDMLQHAQLSLDQAKQAQRAGNVPGLNEGIIALREALSLPVASRIRWSGIRRGDLSIAGGIAYVPRGAVVQNCIAPARLMHEYSGVGTTKVARKSCKHS